MWLHLILHSQIFIIPHLMTSFMRVNDPILTILVSQQETQENNVPAELNYFQAWLVVVQPYQFLVQGL